MACPPQGKPLQYWIAGSQDKYGAIQAPKDGDPLPTAPSTWLTVADNRLHGDQRARMEERSCWQLGPRYDFPSFPSAAAPRRLTCCGRLCCVWLVQGAEPGTPAPARAVP